MFNSIFFLKTVEHVSNISQCILIFKYKLCSSLRKMPILHLMIDMQKKLIYSLHSIDFN